MAEDCSVPSKFKLQKFFERMRSFKKWPFKKEAKCTPTAMAHAGWMCTSNDPKNPAAKCFVCCKELDGWERDDDPWQEHVKHSSDCRFILLNKKEEDWTIRDQLYLMEGRHLKLAKIQLEKKLQEVMDKHNEVAEQIKKQFNITDEDL